MHSVVIVTYNSAEDIGACLRSLDAAPAEFPHDVTETIVIDNASTDKTREIADAALFLPQDIRDGATIEVLPANVGYAAAANVGAARTEGDFITFLNPDTIVSPGWLDRMAAHLAADKEVAAVGPLTNYVAGPQKYQAWMPPNDRRASGGFAGVSELLAEANAGRRHFTPLLIGFCMMIRREAWEEIGPFDERCSLGLEDLEWSLRARRAGKKLAIATDTMIYHRGQRSFRSLHQNARRERENASKDALRAILREWYPEGVPSGKELWGVEWFDTRGEA